MVKVDRDKFLQKAKEQTKEALTGRDVVLCHISKSVDDMNRATNLLGERLEEWFGIYAPEFKMEDRRKHAEIILLMENGTMDMKALSKIVGSAKANQIANSFLKGFGADAKEEDLHQCKLLANQILQIYKLKDDYEKHEQRICAELCPNIANLAGAEIAAKLIARVGSLSRLSVLPSSTIQVLGAEKALFKHLKNRKIDPPKHGIIFQHVSISASPKKVRGKIARALANSIAIAVKADQFTKNSIWQELRKNFEERVKEILEGYKKIKAKSE